MILLHICALSMQMTNKVAAFEIVQLSVQQWHRCQWGTDLQEHGPPVRGDEASSHFRDAN